MKKGLIALVVVMAGAIGVLGYFAYPQIKSGWKVPAKATNNPTWEMDAKIAETDAEKTFIQMYNEFAESLPKIIEKKDKGEELSLDDEWKIQAFGEKMSQFYEQNQLSIKPSVAFAVMDKIAELMGTEKPSVRRMFN